MLWSFQEQRSTFFSLSQYLLCRSVMKFCVATLMCLACTYKIEWYVFLRTFEMCWWLIQISYFLLLYVCNFGAIFFFAWTNSRRGYYSASMFSRKRIRKRLPASLLRFKWSKHSLQAFPTSLGHENIATTSRWFLAASGMIFPALHMISLLALVFRVQPWRIRPWLF